MSKITRTSKTKDKMNEQQHQQNKNFFLFLFLFWLKQSKKTLLNFNENGISRRDIRNLLKCIIVHFVET